MGRHTHPSEQKSVGGSKKNSSSSMNSGSSRPNKKPTSSTLSGGVSLSEKDPNSKNYRPDRWNSDGSMTNEYRDALAKDENDRIMSQGGWGKGYYDRDTGELSHSSGSGGSWRTDTLGSSSFDDDPYRDYMDAIRRQEEAAAEALRKQVEGAVGELQSQKPILEQQYQDSASQAYIQNMLAKKNLPGQLAAQGINGGLAESSNVRLDSQYGNSLNDLQNAYNQGVNQIDRDITATRNNGDLTIAQNKGQYSQQMAQAILQQQQAQAQYEQQLQQMMLQAKLEEEAAQRQHQNNLAYLAEQQKYKTTNAGGSSGRSAKTSYKDDPSYLQLYTEIITRNADLNDVMANADTIINTIGIDGFEDLKNEAYSMANMGYTKITRKGIKQPRINTNQGMATDWTTR